MKILVGYDGSKASIDALNLAIMHAIAFKGELMLITSLKGGDSTHEQEIGAAEDKLKAAKRIMDQASVSGDSKLLIKGVTPAEAILDFADENKVDEIIIGVRRRSKVGKLFFGSNAQKIILEAHCPVVTVK